MEVTEGEEDSTAVAEDFMEAVAEEDFTGVEVSTPESTQGIAAEATTADIVVATMEDGAITEVAAVMAGATAGVEDIGAQDTVTGGVGGLGSGGRIGLGDIRMATTTAHGIPRRDPIILTRTIRIPTTGTTILQ